MDGDLAFKYVMEKGQNYSILPSYYDITDIKNIYLVRKANIEAIDCYFNKSHSPVYTAHHRPVSTLIATTGTNGMLFLSLFYNDRCPPDVLEH